MERFDAYMERCLYGEGGFYSTTGSAGRRRGDFLTSPEVGPLFGAVLAEVLDIWWDEFGQPEDWTVFDVGCGPNTLLEAVRRARPFEHRPWRLVGVDRVDRGEPFAGTRSKSGVERATALPPDLTGAVVVANELLDNLPFRILDHGDDGSWSEVHVDAGAECLVETEARLDIPTGTRAPLLHQAGGWCRSILARNPGRLIVFDYGAVRTGDLARRGGWLRTYRGHSRGHDPFHDPGRWDITTDIAADQLPAPRRRTTQREFLLAAGIGRLVDEGRAYWIEHAHRPDLRALAMRSRIPESEALLDANGLGSWLVLQW